MVKSSQCLTELWNQKIVRKGKQMLRIYYVNGTKTISMHRNISIEHICKDGYRDSEISII